MKKRINIRRVGFMTFVHVAGNKLQRIARRSHFLFRWSSADRNSVHVPGHTILASFLSNGNGVQSTHGWNETSTSSDFPVPIACRGSRQSVEMAWAMEKPLSNWGWYTDVAMVDDNTAVALVKEFPASHIVRDCLPLRQPTAGT